VNVCLGVRISQVFQSSMNMTSVIDHWADHIRSYQPHWNDQLSPSTSFGSWYISPRQIVIESIVENISQVLLLLALYATRPLSTNKQTQLEYKRSWLDWLMGIGLLFSFLVVGFFKFADVDPLRKVFMAMPCHVFTLFQLWVWFDKREMATHVANIMYYLPMGQWFALIFPDRTGYSAGLETWCYYGQHYLLVIMPLYAMATRPYLVAPYNMRTMVTGFLTMNLYHTSILTAGSILTGMNLNFMLNPPKVGIVRSWGTMYRPLVMLACFIIISVAQPLSRGIAAVIRLTVIRPLLAIGLLPSEPIIKPKEA